MSSGREKEFDQYARECVRLAEGVEDPDLREKLLRQAREWMRAEMDEEDGAEIIPSPKKNYALTCGQSKDIASESVEATTTPRFGGASLGAIDPEAEAMTLRKKRSVWQMKRLVLPPCRPPVSEGE